MIVVVEKVPKNEDNDCKQQEEINRLERERRSNNCRISKVKQRDNNENTRRVVAELIWEHRLLPTINSAVQIYQEIEYSYRIGKAETVQDRQILV